MRAFALGRWAFLVALLAPLAVGGAHADDVPDLAKKKYDEARSLLAKGDAKSLAAAFSAVSEAKAKAPDSVDFWELFVRVWRANKKPEADLWDKIVAPREQAAPKSPTFDLVRARVEGDPAKKTEHLQKALDKDPASVPVRLLMVAHLRATGEEGKAEDLLDKVLAERPDDEQALVLKTEMMVESGLSRSAAKFAEEALAKKECPALRYALAIALQRLSKEDDSVKGRALEEAKKAVDGRPDPTYVATLADLLDAADRTSEAVSLLKTHFEKTGDPRLGSRLGALAFRAGDYDAAVKSLAATAGSDVKSAKALALAHARRGRGKEARTALDLVLAQDKEAAPFAGMVELGLGDPAGARRRVQGRSDELSKWVLMRADALEGKVAEVTAAAGKDAGSGSREGEDLLLTLLEARLHSRLAAKSAPLRKQFAEARAAVAQSVVAEAKAGPGRLDLTAVCGPYMPRAVTYLRSACGTHFKAAGGQMEINMDGEGMHIGFAIQAEAECGRDPRRSVRFNAQTAKQGENVTIFTPDAKQEEWKAAEEAFAAGSAALLAEDAGKAAEQFGKAVEAEPNWHRAKLFRSFARAFMPASDLPTAAREALDAVSGAADDWEARTAAITLGVWAGVDVADALKSLQRHVEERCIRRFDQL